MAHLFRSLLSELVTSPGAPRVLEPVPYRVYARDAAGLATIPVRVEGASAGATVRLTNASGATAPVEVACTVTDGVLTGELRSVPTGGPYTLTVAGQSVPGILVGDIWVIAGQSNGEGCGKLIDLEQPTPQVNAYCMDDCWRNAEEPLHWLLEATASVHWMGREDREAAIPWDRAMREQGAGYGLPFAKHLVDAVGVPIGLIPSAHGGTSMDQWSPELRDQGGESLYGAMLGRIAAVGGTVKGILWYQGCSDAWGLEAANAYTDKMRALVAAVRRDTGIADLPFLYVQLGRFYQWEAPAELVQGWDIVREAQRTLEAELAPAAVVPAIDLALDDAIHVGTQGLKQLGRRLAEAALVVAYGKAGALGPRPGTPVLSDGRRHVTIPFTGVTASLTETARVAGFRLLAGEKAIRIDGCRVTGDRQGVEFRTEEPIPAGALLHYGAGLNPTCPLHDERDMPVPTFGPIEL